MYVLEGSVQTYVS